MEAQMDEGKDILSQQQLQKERTYKNKMNEQSLEAADNNLLDAEQSRRSAVDEQVKGWGGALSQENYQGYYEAVQQSGSSFSKIIPPPEQVASMNPQEFQTFKDSVGGKPSTTSNYKTRVRPDNTWYMKIDDSGKDVVKIDQNDPQAVIDMDRGGYKVMSPGQIKTQTLNAKMNVDYESQIADNANAAASEIQDYQMMGELLHRANTGTLAGTQMQLEKLGETFGIKTEGLSEKEAFQTIASKLTIKAKRQDGVVLSGAISDKDMAMMEKAVPQLKTSDAGNKLIIKMNIMLAEKKQEVARAAIEWKDAHNDTMDKSRFIQYVQENIGAKSLFGVPHDGKTISFDSDNEGDRVIYRNAQGRLCYTPYF